MAARKFLDDNGLLYFWGKIKTLVGTKVDKVTGKGLSTNDYTTTEKNKLSGIASGAQVNTIENIAVNGTTQTISGKLVNIPVPTATSDLTNDSGFITTADIPEGAAASTTTPKMDGTAAVGTELAFARGDHRHPSDTAKADKATTLAGYGITNAYTKTEVDNALSGKVSPATTLAGYGITDAYTMTQTDTEIATAVADKADAATTLAGYGITDAYTKSEITGFGYQNATQVNTAISNAIAGITGITYEVVQSLPQTGQAGVIYLISNGGSSSNVYDEYIWVNNGYEKIGTTDVDLTDYMTFDDMVAITNSEIDTIVAS